MGIVRTRPRTDKIDVNATIAAVAALPQCDPFIRSALRTFLAGKLERDSALEEILCERARTSVRSTHPDMVTRWTRHAEGAAILTVANLLANRPRCGSVAHMREHLGKIERAERRAATAR